MLAASGAKLSHLIGLPPGHLIAWRMLACSSGGQYYGKTEELFANIAGFRSQRQVLEEELAIRVPLCTQNFFHSAVPR
jgi:hypothetical protein